MAGLGWRLGRGRGRQLTLAGWGAFAVVVAFLGRADAPFFDAARTKVSDAAAPILIRVRQPLVAFEQGIRNVSDFFTVYRDNTELKRENAELRKWQNVALSLETKVQRYELLLNAAPEHDLAAVTARVIGEANRPFVKTMILNVGLADGVKKGEAVADDRGLIGRIYLAGQHTAWVILLTDLNSRVPVVIEPSHRRAILSGDATGAPQLELDVGDGVVKSGDRVLSSGDGGLLPPDVPVGVVMKNGTDFKVVLSAKADSSDFVRVLDYVLPQAPSFAPNGDGLPAKVSAADGEADSKAAVPAKSSPDPANQISASEEQDH